jgi:hypothetical protein
METSIIIRRRYWAVDELNRSAACYIRTLAKIQKGSFVWVRVRVHEELAKTENVKGHCTD